ncbi:hypothetical protein [Intrasporangium sp. DVR]|uniref:hypothetical protein n=1 Tax=Intrasporangium sp. DVR TaxID=3127867 RepID=UPI00313A550E
MRSRGHRTSSGCTDAAGTSPPDEPEFAGWSDLFAERLGMRGVVVVDVDRVSDSCGYAVPLMSYEGDRDLLDSWAANRGPDGIVRYRAEKNATSIDGLPALP